MHLKLTKFSYVLAHIFFKINTIFIKKKYLTYQFVHSFSRKYLHPGYSWRHFGIWGRLTAWFVVITTASEIQVSRCLYFLQMFSPVPLSATGISLTKHLSLLTKSSSKNSKSAFFKLFSSKAPSKHFGKTIDILLVFLDSQVITKNCNKISSEKPSCIYNFSSLILWMKILYYTLAFIVVRKFISILIVVCRI